MRFNRDKVLLAATYYVSTVDSHCFNDWAVRARAAAKVKAANIIIDLLYESLDDSLLTDKVTAVKNSELMKVEEIAYFMQDSVSYTVDYLDTAVSAPNRFANAWLQNSVGSVLLYLISAVSEELADAADYGYCVNCVLEGR